MNSTLTVVSLISLGALAWKLLGRKKAQQFPPGPKPLPVFGNVFDIPALHSWIKYAEWRKLYGDIIHLKLFDKHIIVINSREVARDLLVKRSGIYSSRPTFHAADMTGWSFNAGFMPYGDLWRQHRSTYTHVLRQQAVAIHQPLQLKYTHTLLRNLLETPDSHRDHFKLYSAGVILDATYGRHIESCHDPLIVVGDEAIEIISNAVIPGFIINMLPILKGIPSWFPGAVFHRQAAHCRNLTHQLLNGPIEVVKHDMRTGHIENPSMASILLDRHHAHSGTKEGEDVVKCVTATMYAAGLETTSAVLNSFILAVGLYPEVQKKARNEIIAAVGPHRLPTFEDRRSLPYVEAVYREVMRHFPVTPLGLPHMTTEDDIYNNFFIPAGTIVITNIWAMGHDEDKYSDPHTFKPERFLGPDGTLHDDAEILAFGFGRRICLGRYFADNTVWIAIASILCAFNIALPENGEYDLRDPHLHFTGTVSNRPKPFQCVITPRDSATRHLIGTESIAVENQYL